jgi:enhancing lycopene biosynthesis protein 2
MESTEHPDAATEDMDHVVPDPEHGRIGAEHIAPINNAAKRLFDALIVPGASCALLASILASV